MRVAAVTGRDRRASGLARGLGKEGRVELVITQRFEDRDAAAHPVAIIPQIVPTTIAHSTEPMTMPIRKSTYLHGIIHR